MSVIRLDRVTKAYPRYHHFNRRLEPTLLHLAEALIEASVAANVAPATPVSILA
jgi:hypothetical protein